MLVTFAPKPPTRRSQFGVCVFLQSPQPPERVSRISRRVLVTPPPPINAEKEMDIALFYLYNCDLSMGLVDGLIIVIICCWLCLFYDGLIGFAGKVAFPFRRPSKKKTKKYCAKERTTNCKYWEGGGRGGGGVFRAYPQPYWVCSINIWMEMRVERGMPYE